jgi:porin
MLWLSSSSARAQPAEDQSSTSTSESEAAEQEKSATAAGQEPPGFGGPSSVGGTLYRDDQVRPTVLEAYFAFKERVKTDHGLDLGFDYQALYQGAGESPGEDTATGGLLRFFGAWELVNRGTCNHGTLVYNIENRHRLGTDLATQDLGFEIGYVGSTDIIVGDSGWALTNLFWEQHLAGDRVAFVAGIVDVTDYLDTYALVDPTDCFHNMAFSTNPTIPAPDQGLGAAFRVMITDRVYVVGGISDGSGDPSDPAAAWQSFFDGAHFTHIELGWFPSFEQRFTDNVHLAAWHADDLAEDPTSSGWGLALSWGRTIRERWSPFVRAGYADGGGGLWERSLSVGFGHFLHDGRDLLGAGLSWAKPVQHGSGSDKSRQYSAEVFHRWRPLKVLSVISDLQLLIDPTHNPDEDLIVVLGLRLRLIL